MEKVKIYKRKCVKSVLMSDQGEAYSLEPWGDDTMMIQGYDDGGKDYLLPDGYKLSKTQYGELAIYHSGVYCDIIMHKASGWPQLVSNDTYEMLVLGIT